MTTFALLSFMKPRQVIEVEPRALRVASLPERFAPAAPPAAPSGPTQPFADARQTSRLSVALEDPFAVTWALRFAAPLRPDTNAHSVLQHGDALLVQAPVWQLFGLDGRPRRAGATGSSPLVITADQRSFCWVNGDGCLVSAPLATGRTVWSYGLRLADGATYPFVGVRGRTVLVVGGEFDANPEANPRQATRLGLEVIDLGDPIEASDSGILRSATTPGTLTTDLRGDVFGAMDDERAVVAWRDHVLTAGHDLAIKQFVTGSFEPRALSLGDAGRTYLIVRTADGPRLWMLNREGEQVFDARLPEDARDTLVPPIVTGDHRVFVVTDTRIVAFSPTGEQLWEFIPPRGRPRAVVTAEGWLLVAVDDAIGVLDAEGRAASFFRLPGEVFCTAPVVTSAGEVIAATERSLVCIGPTFEAVDRTIVR
jgi:outer membrane protein assembly factor BamB